MNLPSTVSMGTSFNYAPVLDKHAFFNGRWIIYDEMMIFVPKLHNFFFSYFSTQNTGCGYSFEHRKQMLKLMDKKIFTLLFAQIFGLFESMLPPSFIDKY